MTPYIIDNCEQLDISEEEAAVLFAEGYIFRPDPEHSLDYYSTFAGVSLDQVEAFLKGYRYVSARNS